MKMTGEQKIPRDRVTVWQALNDLDVLKDCIPGCDSITTVGDNEHEVTMVAAVGPVKAKFKGKLKLTDINAPDSYKILFEGQGGAAGFAKGEAEVVLEDEGAETLLKYSADAQIGGKLAQIGSRLIDSAAKKIAGDFFSRINEKVAPAAEAESENSVEVGESGAESVVAATASTIGTAAVAQKPRVAPAASAAAPGLSACWMWAVGGVIVGSVLTYLVMS